MFPDEPYVAAALVFGFSHGEVWSIDTYWLRVREDGRRVLPTYAESDFRRTLVEYGEFLHRAGIKPPYRWIAGMENLKGRLLYKPLPRGIQKLSPSHDGECLLLDVVSESGVYSPGDPPGLTLEPFFKKLYEACGVSRQEWQKDD
jgi:hypothetical protein